MDHTINVTAEAQRVLAAPAGDPYLALGLSREADWGSIKARYKRLCALHPDKCRGNALAAEAFAVVSAAYAQLQELHSAALAAGPLQASQPEAAPQGNRWTAFTGVPQPKAHPQAQPQQPAHGHSSSQENGTPGTGATPGAPAGGGTWQGSKWGRFGGGSLLRAKPFATGAAAAVGAAAPGPQANAPQPTEQVSSHKQRRQVPTGPAKQLGTDDSAALSGFSQGSSSDGDDSDFEGSEQPAVAAIRPSNFYSSGRPRRSSPAPQSQPPPAASLYGLFGEPRRNSGVAGQAGWLASQAASQPEPPTQPLSQQQGQGGAGQAVSKWGGKSKLADLLKQPPVVPAAEPGSSSQPAGVLQSGGSSGRRPKRQQQEVTLSSSSSSSFSSSSGFSSGSEEEDASDSDAEVVEGKAECDHVPVVSTAATVQERLTKAVLQQEAAARLAAQASGAGIISRGRAKALQRYRKKRRKAAGGSSKAARGGSQAAGSGKASGGGNKAAGSKQQLKLTLSVVRPAISAAAVQEAVGVA